MDVIVSFCLELYYCNLMHFCHEVSFSSVYMFFVSLIFLVVEFYKCYLFNNNFRPVKLLMRGVSAMGEA